MESFYRHYAKFPNLTVWRSNIPWHTDVPIVVVYIVKVTSVHKDVYTNTNTPFNDEKECFNFFCVDL